MQIVAILIGLVLLAVVAYYVSRPLVRPRRSPDVTAIATLEMQRDSLYSQIRELDMDHATGKTNDDDYQRVRAELVAQAAGVLKRIDGVAAQPLPAAAPDDDIEALITARRKSAAAAPRPAADDVEALIAARRKSAAAPKPAADNVEALIAARRKSAAPGAASIDQDIESQIAARRKPAPPAPVAELTCPNCGKPVSADDAFCAKCGASLRATTASQA